MVGTVKDVSSINIKSNEEQELISIFRIAELNKN